MPFNTSNSLFVHRTSDEYNCLNYDNNLCSRTLPLYPLFIKRSNELLFIKDILNSKMSIQDKQRRLNLEYVNYISIRNFQFFIGYRYPFIQLPESFPLLSSLERPYHPFIQ